MTGFFDEPRASGTNRAAPPSDCARCGGDRLIEVDQHDRDLGYDELYVRCPDCNPAPASERPSVQGARWQDYDR